MPPRSATVDESFPHAWVAEVLDSPPLIAPARQYVYPRAIDEVELGALQILLRAGPGVAPVLMTFALGFAELSMPYGIWSCPDPRQLCAVAGGYAYIVQADQPEQWMQIPYRPVLSVHPAAKQNLLIVSSFYKLCALGVGGRAWETAQLSWEGLRVTEISGQQVHGFGWDVATDAEVAFTVNLEDGSHSGGSGPR